MLRSLNELPDMREHRSRICVIGAGAAGITIATELARSGISVALLEAGGLEFEARIQALYAGANVGYPYYPLEAVRLRYFGGTTNHWAGACRPLDPIDFRSRPYVPNSGWPFGRDELDPYYARAHELCRIGPYSYDTESWEDGEIRRLPLGNEDFETAMMRINPARFGELYRDSLDRADNIDVFLHSNVVSIESEQEIVQSVLVRSLAGNDVRFYADVFVLATGALENARLLLASNRNYSSGIGNDNDLVGRFFMEHLSLPAAELLVTAEERRPGPLYEEVDVDGVPAKGFLVPTEALLDAEQILNIRAFIAEGSSDEMAAKSSNAILSAGFIWNDLKAGQFPRNLRQHVMNVIRELDEVALFSYQKAYRAEESASVLICHLEQAPNPNSRVKLAEELDEFGVPRIDLDWQFGELERKTLDRFCQRLALNVGRSEIGRLKILENESGRDWPPGLRGAWHQMGTTRMSASKEDGVVNADGRVHGIRNLYVSGGSVFPTSGYTNPTLTIVALASRLGQMLRRILA